MRRLSISCLFLDADRHAGGLFSSSGETAPLPTIAANNSYLDLAPGWRLRAVIPITRSGAAVPHSQRLKTEGNTLTLKLGNDFLGYETQYFQIERRALGGLRLKFTSATLTTEDRTVEEDRPSRHLFPSLSARLMRLLFLERASQADHNMAVLTAQRAAALEAATHQVQSNPSICRAGKQSSCAWIPPGVALRAEHLDPAHSGNWIPVL